MWQPISIILLLIFLSYGSFMQRGGYADDFVFLAYSDAHPYLEAVRNWSETFNSRVSQGVIMPLLLKVFAGDNPESFSWPAVHLVGLMAFALTVILFFRILILFEIPEHIALVACALFALNPVKNEALLWPATIVGYIIPLCIFLYASWLLFIKASRQTETISSTILTTCLFIFSIFAIEQLLPLFVVAIAVRLYKYDYGRRQLLSSLGGISLITAMFLLITLSGKTTGRLDKFSLDISTFPGQVLSILSSSVIDTFGYAFRIIIDPYYWNDLSSALTYLPVSGTVIALTLLAWLLVAQTKYSSETGIHNKRYELGLLSSGCLIWLAALSPFMVLSYYLPARALYIPSLGLSLIAAAMFAYLFNMRSALWYRGTLIALLLAMLLAYVTVNLYSQQDFTRQWAVERDLIGAINAAKENIPPDTELSLFNLPVSYGPSPGIINDFSFNGMVNWIAPNRNLRGTTLRDFADAFQIPADLSDIQRIRVTPEAGSWVVLWSPQQVVRVRSLILESNIQAATFTQPHVARNDDQSEEMPPVDLTGKITPIKRAAAYNDKHRVSIDTLIEVSHYNIGLLQISVESVNIEEARLRLLLHVRHREGSMQPLDKTVSLEQGFKSYPSKYSKYFFISNFDTVESIGVSLAENGKKLGIFAASGTKRAADASPSATSPEIDFF